jgi:hypothetical protein
MNAREKFHAVMSFQDSASNMKTEFGYWAGSVRRWFEEGLLRREGIPDYRLDGDLVRGGEPISPDSDELVDKNVKPELMLDSYLAKFPVDLSPPLKPELLEENSHYRVLTRPPISMWNFPLRTERIFTGTPNSMTVICQNASRGTSLQ